MTNPLERRSASPAIAAMRRYVTDYVNRHDFSAIAEFMAEDYTLETSGLTVAGRDGAYRSAVAKQLDQFPGLVFTLHEIVHVGDRIGVRFTEHGVSERDGKVAAWPSIAIYRVRDGRLVSCVIEQDYFSRRRQLATGVAVPVDPPAIAPWDTREASPDPAAEVIVTHWLRSSSFLDQSVVQIDDSRATGVVEKIVEDPSVEILEMLAGDGKVAFHAVQRGHLADDFIGDPPATRNQPVTLYMSGLLTVAGGAVVGGNIIRDRWGLYRKLARPAG